MSEMIERVARALAREADDPYEDSAVFWDGYARAALEAMREPTAAMVHAALLLTTQCHGREAIYQAMIDEALK